MKKNYPINMIIPGAHIQMANNQCTNFQKYPCIHLMSTDGGQADGQGKTNIPTKTSFAESIEIIYMYLIETIRLYR